MSVSLFNGLSRCSRRNCGWIGTSEEYDWRRDGNTSTGHCPKCGCHSFYKAKPGDVPTDQPGKTPVRAWNTRTIYWKDASLELPLPGVSVLVLDEDEMYTTFHNGEEWDFETEIKPLWWAKLPEPPAPPAKKEVQ